MEEFLISLLAEGAINAFMDSNKHADNFERGYKALEVGCEMDDEDEIKRAIKELSEVDDDDLLYLRVAANYFLAIGYAKLHKYSQSYNRLDMVHNVSYDFFTRKKDTIEEIRANSYKLRTVIQEDEKEYLEYLERLRREQEEKERRQRLNNNGDNGNFWKIVAIISLALMAILIAFIIIYMLL